jgi:NAD(P)-dependent dehydrogenase (short-subunit alcohol dehydrogenase family)
MAHKKVWFITGAGRGMGTDIAQAALAAGNAVVATGRNTDAVSNAVGDADDLLVVKLDQRRTSTSGRSDGALCRGAFTPLRVSLVTARRRRAASTDRIRRRTNAAQGTTPELGAPVLVRLMRDGMAPPDPLHLVGHRRTISSPGRRASSSPPSGSSEARS